MRKIIILVVLLFTLSISLKANLPQGIAKGFRAGDAQVVAKYLAPTLEISIVGNSSMYSKTQATQVLRDFFNSHNPKKIVEKHNGGRGNSQFSVFSFATGSEKFRATIFYKGSGEEARISQITIEKDSGF